MKYIPMILFTFTVSKELSFKDYLERKFLLTT